jgi:NADPH2 dehydrogenase
MSSSAAASSALFQPLKLGPLQLQHRVALAPLTRFRNTADVPGSAEQVTYYAQRASPGGLLISEGVVVSPESSKNDRVPGLWSEAHVAGWRKVTDAVHANGGFIFAQLWHLGRAAGNGTWQVDGRDYSAVSASATTVPGGKTPARALTEEDLDRVAEEYHTATRNARLAGFDGVEVHGANGYLPNQFVEPITNQRSDGYGGSVERRSAFPLKLLKRVVDAMDGEAGRVGYRISPFSDFQLEEVYSKPLDLYVPFVESMLRAHPQLGYLHVVEPRVAGINDVPPETADAQSVEPLRKAVAELGKGTIFIAAGGFKAEDGIAHANRTGDVLAFGRYFISNPDLPARIRDGHELHPYDRNTFYSQGAKGYTDYPTYAKEQRSANL